MDTGTTASSNTTIPYITVDDGLISQILLFFIFAIAAALIAKMAAVFASWCIKRQAKAPDNDLENLEENQIGVQVHSNVNTGLFAILPTTKQESAAGILKTNSGSQTNKKSSGYESLGESTNAFDNVDVLITSQPRGTNGEMLPSTSGQDNPAFVA